MKLKERLIVAFAAVIIIPVALTILMVIAAGKYEERALESTYGITDMSLYSYSQSVDVLSRLLSDYRIQLEDLSVSDPDKFSDQEFLSDYNKTLDNLRTYMIVRKNETLVFIGGEGEKTLRVVEELPEFGTQLTQSEEGIYLGRDIKALISQIDYYDSDKNENSIFLITDVSDMMPGTKQFIREIVAASLCALILTAILLIIWLHRSIMKPLSKLQVAMRKIKEGNLDFELVPTREDELGELSYDLEAMRRRLKDTLQERLDYDRKNKELISNITHDLKTPVTAIKGYAEGVLDKVADTKEKRERYIRIIYNKTVEIDNLINQLSMYSRFDTNQIPYHFSALSIARYFDDCAEDLQLDLETQGVRFAYTNYADPNGKVIADPEQIKRVIQNIISNSVKYMDKTAPWIHLRVSDEEGGFVRVEVEDNGKGIAPRDLPNIFERFYRADVARNSLRGGSGIGLSVAKKIIEEHGGRIWAVSKEGAGTTIQFVLRKYQEGPVDGEHINH
ncbi:MAG: HAMP domain-containing histidine kinase [Lachnospiraceae bacterium]|nr:HAMP domain-containing histidine kinase [Lachnospiraceae bacterium]